MSDDFRISCLTCGAGPAPGTKHQKCSRCQIVRYCDRACQRANYPAHKTACRLYAARRRSDGRSAPADSAAFRRAMAWCMGIPGLGPILASLAWINRGEGGVVIVEGAMGEGRLEAVSVKRRADWGAFSESLQATYADRFAQADFDPDRHYYIRVEPYSKQEMCATPRMIHPDSSEEIDALAADIVECFELREVDGEVWSGPRSLSAAVNELPST